MADYEFNSTAHTWGETEDNSGDDKVTVETGRERKETVYPGAGDDTVDLGGQPFGYWNSTFDRVKYDAPLQAFNSVTGEYTDRFTITLNQDGSVTVTDLFTTASDYYGTDTLTNVELIVFGSGDTEGSRVFLTPRSEVHVWDVDSRKIDVRGSYFDDVILGGLTRDELRGREGNDIILGDGGKPADDAIVFAGGSPWSKTAPGAAAGTAAAEVTFSTAERSDENRSVLFVDSGGSTQTIDLESATNQPIKFTVTGSNAAAVISSLGSAATESAFVTAVANARDTGHEVTLWFEYDSGAVLLDIFDASDFAAGDRLRGDMGNDFIDGGLSGNSSLNSWSNRNQAYFDGNFSSYDVLVIDPLSSSDPTDLLLVEEFSGGTTIADWWGSYAQATDATVTDLGGLLSALGMSAAASYLASDTRYVVVADTRGSGDGVDILANIGELEFKDRWVNLEVHEDPRQSGNGLTGTNFNGTILADQIVDTGNGYDWIDAGAGNDYVAAGGGGDSIRPGAGNDFVDGGATGTSDNSWENDNRVEMSGGKARFSVTRATESEVTTFWTDNGFGDLGLTYQSSQDYWLITDSSPLYGQGTDLVTNISSINFSDDHVRLTPRVDYRTGTNPNHVTVNIDATGYGDTIDLVTDLDDFVAPSKISSWIADGSMASADHIQYRVNDNAGDDVVIGNGKGTQINAGVGDDVYVGGGSVFIQDATWIGRDEARFQGDRGRFEITRLVDGDTVTDGSSILYDLTSMSTDGIISVNGSDVYLGGTYDVAYLVRDYLPDEFGGLGHDLVVGFDNLSFSDAWLNLAPEVDIQSASWISGNPNRAYYRAGEFGGSYDLRSGVVEGDVTATFMHFEGSQYDDVVIGVENGNFFVGNGGDDFFNAIATTGEAEGSSSNAWDHYDQARYSGAFDRYLVDQVFVKLDSSGFLEQNSDGTAKISEFELNGYTTAIRVADTIGDDGDGTDILVGVEELGFADRSLRPGVELSFDIWTNDPARSYTVTHADVTGDADAYELVLRSQGSEFADVIIGRDVEAFYRPAAITTIDLPDWFGDLVVASRTGSNPLIVYRDTDGDGYQEQVADVADVDLDYQIWVASSSYASGIQGWLDTLPADGAGITLDGFMSPFVDDVGDDDAIEFSEDDFDYDPSVFPFGLIFAGTKAYGPVNGSGDDVNPYDDYYALFGNDGTTFVSGMFNAKDSLEGGAGDDLLFGLGGADDLKGGAGDDVLDGGSSQVDTDQTVYEDPWNAMDRARYDGFSTQYTVTEAWVLRSVDDLILDEVSTDVYDAAPSDFPYYERAVIVEDSLPDELGGTGRDTLIDVERIRFDADGANLYLADAVEFRRGDFIPGIASSNIAGQIDETQGPGHWIPQANIYNNSVFQTTIDLNAIWGSGSINSIDFGPMRLESYFGAYTLQVDGNSQVRLDGTGDTVIGRPGVGSAMQGGGQIDEVSLSLGDRSDYAFAQGVDDNGRPYVEISLSQNTSLATDFETVRLYDIENVQLDSVNYLRLPVGLHTNYGFSFWELPHGLNTTIFDDVIDADTIHSMGTVPGWDDAYFVNGYGGQDTVTAGTDHTIFRMRGGEVFFDGGDGIDGVRVPVAPEQLSVTYFLDANSNKALDDGEEITLAEFQQSNSGSIYNDTDTFSGSDSNKITLSEYDQSYDAGNLFVDPVASRLGLEGRGAGWFSYADDYYVQIQDLASSESGDLGAGTMVLHDVGFLSIQQSNKQTHGVDLLTGEVFAYTGSLLSLDGIATDDARGAVGSVLSAFYTEVVTYVVTVDEADGSNRFFIDGVDRAGFELVPGKTYRFDLSDPSTASHPFAFKTGDGTEYTDGVTVTGTQGSDGVLVFVVPDDVSAELEYYCELHPGMGADVSVTQDLDLDLGAGERAPGVVGVGDVTWFSDDPELWHIGMNVVDTWGDSVYRGTPGLTTLDVGSDYVQKMIMDYQSGSIGEAYKGAMASSGADRGDGAISEKLSPIIDPVIAGTNTSTVTIPLRDRFQDGPGDDIFIGLGEGSVIAEIANSQEDRVAFTAAESSERFEIGFGALNQFGYIPGATGSTASFQGTPGEQYVMVRDTVPDALGGYGTNYMFGIERLDFGSYETVQVGLSHRVREWGSDNRVVLEVKTGGHVGDVVLPNIAGASDAFAAGDFVGGLIIPGPNDGLVVGFTSPDPLSVSYKDRVRISEDPSTFSIEHVFLAESDTATLVEFDRDSGGDPTIYGLGDQAPTGYSLVDAYLLSDSRPGSAGGYEDMILVDIEELELASEYISFRVERSWETQDWNIRYLDGAGNSTSATGDWQRFKFSGHDYGNVIHPTEDEWGFVVAGDDGLAGDVYEIRAALGSGDDVVISELADLRITIEPGAGDDYLYRDETINLDTVDYSVTDDSRVALWDYEADRFSINQVWISIDDQTKMPLYRANGDIKTWDAPGVGLTQAFRVADKVSSAVAGYLGEKIVVGFDRISFKSTSVDLTVTSRSEDWDGDGQIDEYRQEGSAAGDRLVGQSSTARDRLDGREGDDVLIGGDGGDVLSGGLGDDLLIGGANGTSGNDWQDSDRADYYELKRSQLDISKVTVAYNSDTNSVIRDGGQIVTDATASDLRKGFELKTAYQVTDKTATYGTDILIDMERIGTSDGDLRIGLSYRVNDWDDDGVINEVGVEGSAFADAIKAAESGGDVPATYMSYQNWINAGAGDDDIYAGSGGDWIRVGAGNDFVNGGANGQEDEWGWVRKDEVRFDTTYSRFDIESVTWDGTSTSITNTLGSVVFKIDSSGKILRNEGSSYRVLDTIAVGDRYTVVEDKLPNIEGLESEGLNLMINVENLSFEDKWLALEVQHNIRYRADGSIEYSNVNGTDVADTLTGTNAHDWMNGSGGDDVLIGRGDGDSFSGGFGDDMIFGDGYLSDGSDGALDGEDRVHYDGNFDQYVITRKTGVFEGVELEYLEVADLLPSELGGSGVDQLFAIENLSFADNWLDAGVRVDEYFDNDGNLRGTYVRGSAFNDTIQGSRAGDEIRDGAGDDVLYGNAGADIFIIGAGNDTVYGGAEGKNPWGTDDVDEARFEGKISEFMITYFDADGAPVAAYDDAGFVVVSHNEDDGLGENTLYGIERLKFQGTKLTLKRIEVFQDLDGDGIPDEALIEGSTGDDTGDTALNGSVFADVIRGFTGDDTLSGGEGDDRLEGGKGNDTIDGGNGVDTVVFAGNFADYTISSNSGVYTVTDNQVDDEQSEFDATDANADRYSDEGTDTITNVEFFEFADVRASLAATYMVRDFDKDGDFDLALYRAAVGGTTNLTVDGFESGAGLTADLSAINFYFTGGPGVDSATFGSGDDVVIASLGADSFSGGDGVDVLRIDGEKADYTVSDSGGSKIVGDGSGWTVTLTDFERIEYSDGLSNLVKTQEHADVNANGTVDVSDFFVLSGTDANDASGGAALSADSSYLNYRWEISGFDGDDSLTGGNLDDVLDGGLGSDTIDGGGGFDVVVVDANKGDVTISPSGSNWTVTMADASVDTLSNVEAIRFQDTLERLETKVTLVEEFVFGEGIVTTYVVEGTNFDDTMGQAGAYPDNSVEFSGGDGDDTFVFDLGTFDELATILDFEGLDSGTNTANDVLRFSNTSSTAADILATAEQADGGILLTAGDGQIWLENVDLADLSSTVNIEVV